MTWNRHSSPPGSIPDRTVIGPHSGPYGKAVIGDVELLDHRRRAIALKPRGHDFTGQPGQVVRFMAQTGG